MRKIYHVTTTKVVELFIIRTNTRTLDVFVFCGYLRKH